MSDFEYPRFIDFEASGLSDASYPIEVAWNDKEGNIKSFLIDPTCIDTWTHWDQTAENDIHHISLEMLKKKGDKPTKVAQKMNKALKGQTLYSDQLEYDKFWLNRLFESAEMKPAFHLRSSIDLFNDQIPDKQKTATTTPEDRFERIICTLGLRAWENIGLKPHRAANDVKHFMETYRLLVQNGGKLPAK